MIVEINTFINNLLPLTWKEFLLTTLYESKYIVIQYWSILHVLSGVFFYKFISKDFKKWILVSILFEVFELIMASTGDILYVEKSIDIIWDIIFNLYGFLFIQYKIEGKTSLKFINKLLK